MVIEKKDLAKAQRRQDYSFAFSCSLFAPLRETLFHLPITKFAAA